MTSADFRQLAVQLPEVMENEHFGHPDFRTGGKIFATLGSPDARHGMVKLPPDIQARAFLEEPGVYSPAAGAWGLQGSTLVLLEGANEGSVEALLREGWQFARSKRPAKPRVKRTAKP